MLLTALLQGICQHVASGGVMGGKYRLKRFGVLGNVLWNTDFEALIKDENRDGYGCKDGLPWVKERLPYGVRS